MRGTEIMIIFNTTIQAPAGKENVVYSFLNRDLVSLNVILYNTAFLKIDIFRFGGLVHKGNLSVITLPHVVV